MVILKNLMTFPLNQNIQFFSIFQNLEKCDGLDPKKRTKTNHMNLYDTASKLHNDLLKIYYGECNKFPDAKIKKMVPKYNPINKTLNIYDCEGCFS